MDIFNCVYLETLLVLLVCSSLSVATWKEPDPVLKCNSFADAEDRGREKSSHVMESPFLLQVTRTDVKEYINEIGFQYRVELYAAEPDQKFRGFLIQAHHPTNINLSNSKTLMKGTGFFTDPGSEWEPVTCQTTNDSAINTTSSLKEFIHLTWETPSSGIPTKFWYIVQDENGFLHSSTQEINLHLEGFTRRSRTRRSASNGDVGPGLGHCTYDVPDSGSSTGSCVAAGYDQCCPGTNGSCRIGPGSYCYCDEACLRIGDCCRDLNELNCICNRTLPIITSGLNNSSRVQLGDRFSFECVVRGVPIPNIVWLKDASLDLSDVNDTNLDITYSDPASSQVTSTLTVLKVSFGYRGTYTCLAINNAGSDRSTGILTITDRVHLNLEDPHDNMATHGENVTFNCAVHSNLVHSLTWLHTSRNGTTAAVNGQVSQLTITTTDMLNVTYHFLTIDSVEYSDAGNYTCVAMFGIDSISTSTYLSVSVPAEVQVRGHNTVTEFETLVISCKAVGYPLPAVQWFRNGALMSNLEARISISTEIHMEGDSTPFVMSQLQIIRVASDDSGFYQCSAENGYVRSNGNITVTVSTINECILALARGGTTPCQNGGTCEDSVGTYYCHCAEGYAGTSCTEEVLGPSEPPMIVAPPPDTPTPLVNALNLTCGATGNPPPTYRWYRDGELLPGAVLPYLYIGETTPEDRGYYHCEVMNSLDRDQSLPALVTIPGVYQFSIEVELNDSTFGILDLPAEIVIDGFSGRSNISLYSVRLLGNYTNEQAQLLFTVLINTHTTVGIADAITQELHTLPLNLLTEPERYDGCQARTDQIAEGVSIYFSWNESEIGSHSFHPCPCKDIIEAPANATISRRCGGTYSTRGRWDEVDYSQCFTNITLKLCEASLSAGSSQALAETVATITNDFMNFEPSDVSVTATLIGSLTQDAVQDPEVRVNYLDAIDNLLRANSSVIRESQMQSNTSSRLLESLTAFSDNVPLQNDSNTTTFTRNTFALLVKDVDVMGLNDETLYVNLGTVEEATNTSELIDPNSLVVSTSNTANMNAVTTAEVEVPQTVLIGEGKPTQRLSYTVFANDSLFQSADETQSNITLGSIVVSVRVNVSNELPNPIRVTFLINMLIENASRAICAEWNTSGAGEWYNNTCTVTGRNRDSDHRTYVQAEYSRPGHFGILLDLNPSLSPSSFALQAISYIGVIVSIACLTAFIVTYAASKSLRSSEHGQILMNMSCSLAGFYIIFLIAGNAAPVAVLCGISAALLQYFMLVYFGWTAAEAVYLYIKLVKVLGTNIARYVLKAALIVWLVPLLIVAVSAGAGYNYYDIRQIVYCRAEKYPFWFGLVLPFGVIYLFNWVIFFLIMRSVFKLNKQSVNPNKKETKKKAFIAIGLATVLGLGWGFGLLATSSDLRGVTLAFQIIFSIFVGCQGLLLFILHGLRSVEARKVWKLWFSTISNKSVQLYADARSSSMMTLPRAKRSSNPTSPLSSVYEMSDISKGSTLPRPRKVSEDEMEVSAKEKQTNESVQPIHKQNFVLKAIQSLARGKHAQEMSEMPPISTNEPVVLTIVRESSAEDKIDHATAEATTSGDQQENKVTGRNDKCDLANKSESSLPAQRESDIMGQDSYPILPMSPDDTNPEES